jgi:hypothetical protein
LRWPLEAVEVVDLEAEHERGQRVDAAEAAHSRDSWPPLALARQTREPLIECGLASGEAIDGGKRVEVGELSGGFVEALPRKPLTVTRRPTAGLRPDAAVQEQQLRDTMPRPHQIWAHLFASATEMPRRFNLPAGHRHRLQLSCEQEPREQLGVLAVALDPIAGRARRLARRDHIEPESRLGRRAIEREAGRARLVTGVHGLRQSLQPSNYLVVAGAEPRPPQLAAEDVDRSRMRRASVDVKPRECHRSGHGRTLLPLHGVSRSPSPARQTPDL